MPGRAGCGQEGGSYMRMLQAKFPPKLNQGDTIGIVAPAFPWTREGMEGSIRCFEDLGYRVKLGSCAQGIISLHGYLAGEARQRAADLMGMFEDQEVKAIFCARGGYGASQVLPFLDFDAIRRNPKVFVGYSDITNLHMAIFRMTGLVTFHGPMAASNLWKDFDPYSWESLMKAVNMGQELRFVNPPDEEGVWTVRPGTATGLLVGGNLSVITRAVGTFYQLDTAGKILLLEEVDETIPKIDVMLTQLEHAGMMAQVAGVLLGDFTGCSNDKYDSGYTLDQFFRERFAGYRVPVLSHIRTGHGKPMGTVPLGSICRMDTEEGSVCFFRELAF